MLRNRRAKSYSDDRVLSLFQSSNRHGDLPYPGTATHGERRTVAEAESESVGLKAPWVEAWGMIVIVVFWDGRV